MNETTLREALKSIPRYVLDGPEGAEEYVPTPDGDLIFADDLDAALARADDGLDVDVLARAKTILAFRSDTDPEVRAGRRIPDWVRRAAEREAAEYARLAEQGEQG